jgi:hypothetical protein
MRWSLVLLALAACPPRFDPEARSGEDGSRDYARVLALVDQGWAYEVERRDVVTARGGDRTDWVAFDVPATCAGATARVILAWDPPRPGLDLSARAITRTGEVVAEGRPGYREASFPVDRGRYWVEVAAPGRDDAGAYRLAIEVRPERCPSPDDSPPDLSVARPDGTPLAIAAPGFVAIASWDRRAGVIYALIEAGSAEGITDTTRVSLVDAAGAPVPDVEVRLRSVRAHSTVVEVSGPGWEELTRLWTAEVTLPAPTVVVTNPTVATAPMDALIVDVDPSGTDLLVVLDRGTLDGVAVGFQGPLLDNHGQPMKGTWVVVTAVDSMTCRAVVTGVTARKLARITSARVGP